MSEDETVADVIQGVVRRFDELAMWQRIAPKMGRGIPQPFHLGVWYDHIPHNAWLVAP